MTPQPPVGRYRLARKGTMWRVEKWRRSWFGLGPYGWRSYHCGPATEYRGLAEMWLEDARAWEARPTWTPDEDTGR